MALMCLLSAHRTVVTNYTPSVQAYCIGGKFGGLCYNRQIKIGQNFLLAYIRMAILYQTAKFKLANILAIAIMGSTTKFNSRQYFRLYSSIGFRSDPPEVGYARLPPILAQCKVLHPWAVFREGMAIIHTVVSWASVHSWVSSTHVAHFKGSV